MTATGVPERDVKLPPASDRLRTRGLDRLWPEIEVSDEAVHGAVQRLGTLSEPAGPERTLLRRWEARNIQTHGRPPQVSERLAGANEQQPAKSVREHGRPLTDVRVCIVVHLEQQRVAREHGLSPPKAAEGVPLGCRRRHIARPQHEGHQAEPGARRRSDGASGIRIVAAQCSERRRVGGGAGEDGRQLGGDGLERRRQLLGHVDWHKQGLEPVVEIVQSCQVVQHSFVDAEWARGDALAGVELHEAVPAQGCSGRDRAPVRIRKGREGKAERGSADALVTGGGSAQAGEARFELDSRTEEQDVSLERGQAERLDQRLEYRRLCTHAVDVRRPAVGMRFERPGDSLELRAECPLVLGEPVGHGNVTVGSENVPPTTSSRLSAPSTWTRRRYVPGRTRRTGNTTVGESAVSGVAGNV